MSAPSLVCVTGPLATWMLDALVDHYRDLGVGEVLVGLHLPDDLADADADRLTAEVRDRVDVCEVHRGPWTAETNGIVRDRLRERARSDWHVIADSDELQHHPEPLPDRCSRLEDDGHVAATGLLWDRISADGSLVDPLPPFALDPTYPRGGFVTAALCDGDPRKATLVRADAVVGSGNHRVLGDAVHHLDERPWPVHHFKWRGGVVAYVRRRAEGFAGSDHPEERSMHAEARTVLDHIATHDGGLDPDLPGAFLRPTRTGVVPAEWDRIAAPLWEHWQRDRWRGVDHWWDAGRR